MKHIAAWLQACCLVKTSEWTNDSDALAALEGYANTLRDLKLLNPEETKQIDSLCALIQVQSLLVRAILPCNIHQCMVQLRSYLTQASLMRVPFSCKMPSPWHCMLTRCIF